MPVMTHLYYRPRTDALWDNIANVPWPDQVPTLAVAPSRGWCVPPGDYRVDVFAGDRKLDSLEVDMSDLPDRVVFHDPALGGSACRPADWDVAVDPDTHWAAFVDPSQSQVAAIAAVDGLPTDLPGLAIEQVRALESGLPRLPYSLHRLLREGLPDRRTVEVHGAQWTVRSTTVDGIVLEAAHARGPAGALHWILWATPEGADAQTLTALVDSVLFATLSDQ